MQTRKGEARFWVNTLYAAGNNKEGCALIEAQVAPLRKREEGAGCGKIETADPPHIWALCSGNMTRSQSNVRMDRP